MKKKIAAGIAAAALALSLTACGGDAHKGEHCIAHNTVLVPVTHWVGKMAVTTYISSSECSQWVPNDPATAGASK